MSLDISDVITSQYEDCVEPIVGDPTFGVAESSTVYFEATTSSDTTPPPRWRIGSTCTAGDTGLVCTSTAGSILQYDTRPYVDGGVSGPADGPPGPLLAIVSFDVVTASGTTTISAPNMSSITATTTPQRVTLIVEVEELFSLNRNASGVDVTISNLHITYPTADATASSIGSNQRLIFTLADATTLGAADDYRGYRFLTSFDVPAAGTYNVGTLCADSGGCDYSTSCRLYGPDSNQISSSLGYEWDPSLRVDDPDFNGSITRTAGSVDLEAGTHIIACDSSARVFVRSFDDNLVRSCNFLTWYFSLRQGGQPVTGLQASSIIPTVDGTDLGVEAGAALTQNNTSRVALLMDRSFSITNANAKTAVIDSAKAFVDAMPAGTYYQVHQFASETTVPVDILNGPTEDVDAVKTSLDSYDPPPVSNSAGFTKLFDAIGATAVQGFNEPVGQFKPPNFDFLQRVMVVFTDGDDTASLIFVDSGGTPYAPHVVDQLDVCRVNALSVGLGSGIQEATLRSLTGDSVFLAAANTDLQETFQAVAQDLNSRYRLKMVTPQPVQISNSSSLRIDFNGETVTAIYEPPSADCVLQTSPIGGGSLSGQGSGGFGGSF